MANMYNINSLSYTTHENPEWFTRAMFGGRLIQGGYIRVLTGIKGDELLSQIDLQNKVLQIDGKDCAWTPNQIIKLSEKTAKVTTYKINLEQCIDELEQKRTLYQLSPGAKNEDLPDELEAATLMLIAIALSNEIEEMIIGGDSAVDPNQFDGLVKQALASTQAAHIIGTTLTSANIAAAIEAVYDAFPENVLQTEDAGTLFVFGSYGARRKLRKALSTMNSQVLAASWTIDDTDKKNPKIYYLGVEFVPVKGIGENTLIGIDSTNAFLLTDLLSDLEDIKMGNFPEPNEDKIFIKGRLRLGFAIPFEDEVVIWSDKITVAQAANNGNGSLAVVPNSLVFSAAGEAKTFNIITPLTVTPVVGAAGTGFSRTVGATAAAGGVNVTTVTVTATTNVGNRDPKVAELDISLPGDVDRSATVTLNQRNEDVTTIVP